MNTTIFQILRRLVLAELLESQKDPVTLSLNRKAASGQAGEKSPRQVLLDQTERLLAEAEPFADPLGDGRFDRVRLSLAGHTLQIGAA